MQGGERWVKVLQRRVSSLEQTRGVKIINTTLLVGCIGNVSFEDRTQGATEQRSKGARNYRMSRSPLLLPLCLQFTCTSSSGLFHSGRFCFGQLLENGRRYDCFLFPLSHLLPSPFSPFPSSGEGRRAAMKGGKKK